jgi:hypothetical protein
MPEDQAAFKRKLRAAADKIRAEAKGRTCSGCIYYRESWCAERVSISGLPLLIMSPSAPACDSHTPLLRTE